MTPITIQTPPAFSFRATLLSHGWRQLAPFDHDEELTTLERIHRLEDGAVVRLAFREGAEGGLEVTAEGLAGGPTRRQRQEIATAVRRIFNLDLDLSGFYELLRGEERYAWVERAGSGRLLRAPTVWEDLAKTLLTTNTTWGGTRGMVRRLTDLGEAYAEGLHAFPSPQRLAALAPDELGETIRAGYRSAFLHELATRIAAGHLDVEAWAAPDLSATDLYQQVSSLKGFGPYAAGAVLKLLGRFERLALDTAARGMFARTFNGGEPPTDAQIQTHYEPYGPWRGLVLWVDLMGQALAAAAVPPNTHPATAEPPERRRGADS